MILNAPIIISLFLASLGLLLGLAAATVWLRRTMGRDLPAAGGEPEGRGLEGEGAYLVFLLLLTAFGLRAIAWPLSYLALDSAVPHVSGAMCIFGVTRLCPLWANLMQALRPLLIFALGGWLTLRLTRSAQERRVPGTARPRSPAEQVLFLVSLVLLLLDCLLEIVVLLSLRQEQQVYCCGSVYDLPDRFSSLLPGSLFGAAHAQLALPILAGCGLLCAFLCLLAGVAALRGWWISGPGRHLGHATAFTLFLFLPLLAVVAAVAGMEVITPRLTGLPYHHCLYCLLGKTARGPWITVTLAAGALCAAWGALLLPGRSGRSKPAGMLLLTGGVLLSGFLGLALVLPGAGEGAGDLGTCPACQGRLFDTVYLVEVVGEGESQALFCSVACALQHIREHGGAQQVAYVTVRDEFTGKRLDSGAAFFVEAAGEIEGLPPGNRWHAYQYQENGQIMAFELDGNVVDDPFMKAEDEGR